MNLTLVLWEHKTFEITRIILKTYLSYYKNILHSVVVISSSSKNEVTSHTERILEIASEEKIQVEFLYEMQGSSLLDKASLTETNTTIRSSDIVLFCPGDNFLAYSENDINILNKSDHWYCAPRGVRCHLKKDGILSMYQTGIKDKDYTGEYINSLESSGMGNNASTFWGLFKTKHFLKRMNYLATLNKLIDSSQSIISDSAIGAICSVTKSFTGESSFEFRMADISEDSSLATKSKITTRKKSRMEVINEFKAHDKDGLVAIIDNLIKIFIVEAELESNTIKKVRQAVLKSFENYAVSGIMGAGRIRRDSYNVIVSNKVLKSHFQASLNDQSFCNLYIRDDLSIHENILERLPPDAVYCSEKFWSDLKLVRSTILPHIINWNNLNLNNHE